MDKDLEQLLQQWLKDKQTCKAEEHSSVFTLSQIKMDFDAEFSMELNYSEMIEIAKYMDEKGYEKDGMLYFCN